MSGRKSFRRLYHLSGEMRKIADALFQLADANKELKPDMALECYREARELAAIGAKVVTDTGGKPDKAMNDMLKQLERRARSQQMLGDQHRKPIPVESKRVNGGGE